MAVQISGNDITVPRDTTVTRNLTVGGVLTYEDVTNVDSVGLVTARSGLEIGARPGVAASISVDGNMIISGISTFNGDILIPIIFLLILFPKESSLLIISGLTFKSSSLLLLKTLISISSLTEVLM